MSQIDAREFRDAAKRLRSLGVAADVVELLEAQARVRPPVIEVKESPQLNEFAAALAKAQGAMQNPAKDRVNTFFKSRYATLASAIDAIRKPLAENGLSYMQEFEVAPDRTSGIISTTVMHQSGQWRMTRRSVPIEPGKGRSRIQDEGTAETYGRRYALCAALGLAADVDDEDDDGNVTEERPRTALDEAREKAQRLAEQKSAAKTTTPRVVRFGELKGKPLSEVTTDDLIKLQELGGEKIGKEPRADWAPTLKENLLEISAEIERRIAADETTKTS